MLFKGKRVVKDSPRAKLESVFIYYVTRTPKNPEEHVFKKCSKG